jgi:hypothetical protein
LLFYWDLVSSIISKECDCVYVPDPYVPDPPPPGDTDNNQDPATEYLSQREAEISDSLSKKDNFLLNCDSLTLLQIAAYQGYGSMYQDVAKFHISDNDNIKAKIDYLQDQVGTLSMSNFNYINLENASGTIVNSDFFPVRITNMPTGTTPVSLLEYFRLNINSFISVSNGTSFTPYNDGYIDDTGKWNQQGKESIGAFVHIHLLDDGTVVESDYQSNSNSAYFTFSTMISPMDGIHPVSGNRRFGVYADPNRPGEFTFYTMGVDRTSDWVRDIANTSIFGQQGFKAADALWSDIQKNMINKIKADGGQAQYYSEPNYIARPDYITVKDFLDGKISIEELKRKIGC